MTIATRRAVRTLLCLAMTAAAAGATACASAGGSSSSKPRVDQNLMDTTALRNHNYTTVYDAISRVHADWFVPRGGAGAGAAASVGVFVQSQRRELGLNYLREIRPEEILSVKHLTAGESLQDYGWQWGAIVITRR